MSTIWTPSGERPIRPDPEPERPSEPAGTAPPPGYGDVTEEELQAQFAEVQRQLLATPVEVVVANHAIGLFQLAVLHLEQSPPGLKESKLAIDAMAAVVEGLRGRLGEEEQPLREALAQLQLAFVQRQPAGGQAPDAE